MPNIANPLYANGVPTYSNDVGALAGVFQQLAPNPLRDLQIQGYASNARLAKLRGDMIQGNMTGQNTAADLFQANDIHGANAALIRGGNSKLLNAMPGVVLGDYSARALQDPNSVNPNVQAALSVGAGHNYADTVPGFTANQDRQTREANQKNETTMRGQNLVHDASIYGADQQASVGHERNKFYQTAEANTLGENTRYHNLQNAAELDKNDVIYDVGMDRNQKGLQAKQYDTDHDARKTTAGLGAVIDPTKLDEVVLQSVPGSYKDNKGHWQVDPSVSAGDLQEVRNRTAARMKLDPRNPYQAVQQSVSDVFGANPNVTPEDPGNWWKPGSGKPMQVQALPVAQRPPMSGLAQQFVAPPAAPVAAPPATLAPVPVPTAAPPAAAPVADLPRPSNKAEMDALPSGAVFIAPDGSQHRKV